jgi:hypothetical protein
MFKLQEGRGREGGIEGGIEGQEITKGWGSGEEGRGLYTSLLEDGIPGKAGVIDCTCCIIQFRAAHSLPPPPPLLTQRVQWSPHHTSHPYTHNIPGI